ncbi:MAG: DMT family transporter [Thermoguttaceae bacterium]|nr:DMT family transporter [Thermoguttaceae bacterium]
MSLSENSVPVSELPGADVQDPEFASAGRFRGILLGILAAVTYGMNPLFTLPVYRDGIQPDSVLFYRYGFGILVLGLWMLIRRISFAVPLRDLPLLLFGGILAACSSLFLFLSYQKMDAGIASTLLFTYPILTAVFMALFFHEKAGWKTIGSILLAVGGVGILCRTGDGAVLNMTGVLFVFLSSLFYAVYLVSVKVTRMKLFSPEILTFYSILFGFPVFFVRLDFGMELQLISEPLGWLCVFSLGLIPTVISLAATAAAIRLAGPTTTAILGALEPATAVFLGILVFGEPLTIRLIFGLLLIGFAAVLCALGGKRRPVQ